MLINLTSAENDPHIYIYIYGMNYAIYYEGRPEIKESFDIIE